jgi:EmrB/QacA subfamily drug resistance transporter
MTDQRTRFKQAAPPRTGLTAVIAVVALASLMLPMAVTAPAVALGDMAADLGASSSEAQWVLNAYNVTFAAFMLAAGGLADLFGRRRVLTIGVVVFASTSALCAVIGNPVVVDVLRGIQGIGSAGILTTGAAILANSFTGPARARAFGVLGASFGFGLALGPLLGGALVDAAGWRSVFWINVVVSAGVLLLIRHVVESRDPDAKRVDIGGLVTFTASLFLLALAFVEGPTKGWGSYSALTGLVGFVVFLALFVLVESRQQRPMFDLSLFRRPTFIAVVCQPFTITFGFAALLVYLPPYFQGVGGASALASGALLLPLTLPVLLVPFVAGALTARIPLRIMLATSSLLIAVGSLWLVILQPESSWITLVPPLLVFGIGVGSAFGVMDNAAVSVVPKERAGMASGIFNTMRIAGEGIAIAGGAAVLVSMTGGNLIASGMGNSAQATAAAGQVVQGNVGTAVAALPGSSAADATAALATSFTSAVHVILVVLAVLALLGAVATFTVIKDRDLNGSS